MDKHLHIHRSTHASSHACAHTHQVRRKQKANSAEAFCLNSSLGMTSPQPWSVLQVSQRCKPQFQKTDLRAGQEVCGKIITQQNDGVNLVKRDKEPDPQRPKCCACGCVTQALTVWTCDSGAAGSRGPMIPSLPSALAPFQGSMWRQQSLANSSPHHPRPKFRGSKYSTQRALMTPGAKHHMAWMLAAAMSSSTHEGV